MELIRGLHNLRPRHHGCVASIGNYDCVHRGHRAVIEQLAAQGRALGLPVTIITFEPHPRDFFSGGGEPLRVIGIRDKLEALRACGVERVWCLRFNGALAAVGADDFISRYLVAGIGVRYLVVGDDFRFGRGRVGDFALLKAAADHGGYEVACTAALRDGDQRISSTLIRQLLRAAEFERVAQLLGRPLRLSGKVVGGDRRGREWGFPTANIGYKGLEPLLRGVFVVRVDGADGAPQGREAVANIGTRPTVGGNRCVFEVHLLDFEGDLYGRRLGVTPLKKLRDEVKFDSSAALRTQIGRDIEDARAYFADHAAGAGP